MQLIGSLSICSLLVPAFKKNLSERELPPTIIMLNAHLETARRIRLHNLSEVAHELGEGGADLAMLDDEGLGVAVAVWRVRRLDVCPCFASPAHCAVW